MKNKASSSAKASDRSMKPKTRNPHSNGSPRKTRKGEELSAPATNGKPKKIAKKTEAAVSNNGKSRNGSKRKLKFALSIEHVSTAHLLAIPIARPPAASFDAVIGANIKMLWEENAFVHTCEINLLRKADTEGRVLWGYSQFRVPNPEARLTWADWDRFIEKHLLCKKRSPGRPPVLDVTSIADELRYLSAEGVITIEGTLLAQPKPEKPVSSKKRGEKSVTPVLNLDEDEDTDDDPWSFSAAAQMES